MNFPSVRLSIMLLMCCCLITSCDDNDEIPDTEDPSVVITSPVADDLLHRIVLVQAKITEVNLQQVEVFIDDQSIATSVDSVLEISFDTRQVEDGAHILKIVARDKEGNEGEQSIEIEVWNTLVRFSVPDNGISAGREVWVFITTDEGQLIGAKKAENGSDLLFTTPEDYKKKKSFVIHQLTKSVSQFPSPPQNHLFIISSYTGALPGWYWRKPDAPQGSSLGTHTFTLGNKPAAYLSTKVTGPDIVNVSTSIAGNLTTYVLSLKQNNTPLFYGYSDFTGALIPKYRYFPNAGAGQTASADFSELEEMSSVDVTIGQNAGYVGAWISAFENGGAERTFALWSNSANAVSSFRLFYPGNVFSEYLTTLTVGLPNLKTHYYHKIGSIPTSFKYLQGDITSLKHAGNKLTLSASGTFDVLMTQSYSQWSVPGINYTLLWTYYTDGVGEKQYVVPAFPTELLTAFPELSSVPTKFSNASISDYDSFSGYEEYLDFYTKSNTNVTKFYKEHLQISANTQSIGGRK